MKATYAGDQMGGVEIDGLVVLPGETHEFPDGSVLSVAWLVDGKPYQQPVDEPAVELVQDPPDEVAVPAKPVKERAK